MRSVSCKWLLHSCTGPAARKTIGRRAGSRSIDYPEGTYSKVRSRGGRRGEHGGVEENDSLAGETAIEDFAR